MRKPLSVAILGATGMVGRRMSELLTDHPWFDVKVLVGFRSVQGSYLEAWDRKELSNQDYYGENFWKPRPFPAGLESRTVQSLDDLMKSEVDLVFSAIPEQQGKIEQDLADAGNTLFSNSPYGRFEPHNPLIIPEINLGDLNKQRLIKNPNCVTSGLALVLYPLVKHYGVEEASAVTFQSLSGRGDAKYDKDLVLNNVYPLHDSDENTETYIQKEVKRILGTGFKLSVSCNRVFVQEGHFVDVKIKTVDRVNGKEEVARVLESFNPLEELHLPTSPKSPVVVLSEIGRPRPAQDSNVERGMSVVVGGIATDDEVYDLRLQLVVNNLVRGAAGGAILNAECYARANNMI
ncbi:MAG: aspartate-semialdehyde dehydrogenase [Pyrinomonadaceae bacterium]